MVISGASRIRPSSRVCVDSSLLSTVCWMFRLKKMISTIQIRSDVWNGIDHSQIFFSILFELFSATNSNISESHTEFLDSATNNFYSNIIHICPN